MTLFIVLGILLIVLIGIGLYFFSSDSGNSLFSSVSQPSEIIEIEEYNQECLEGLAKVW